MEIPKVRWDPTINMGHIITMATSLISSLIFVMVAWSSVDKRVLILEEARTSQAQSAHDRQEMLNDKIVDVKSSLNEVKASIENLRRDVQAKK